VINLKIKQLLDEDFVNYKKPSMFVGFPNCTWKCEKDCGEKMCQNKELALSPDIEISCQKIVDRYMQNPITKAIVCGGLEPFDNWEDLVNLIHEFRKHTQDFIVIYSGFYLSEINDKVEYLRQNYDNIIIKFGRFVPNQEPHYDEVLGVRLASSNQYAERIS
jgi:organic radical activating enzyme